MICLYELRQSSPHGLAFGIELWAGAISLHDIRDSENNQQIVLPLDPKKYVQSPTQIQLKILP